MNKREAIRWIKRDLASEIRHLCAHPPERINEAPDPQLVESLWAETAWDVAERLAPEQPLKTSKQT